MDAGVLITTLIDFATLWVPFTILTFIVYKLGAPAREHVAEKYKLTWTKSCLALNFGVLVLFFIAVYAYFFFVGASLARPNDPGVELTIIDDLATFAFVLVRIIVVSLILMLFLYFFELVGSFVIEMQKKSKRSLFVKQVIGIGVTCALFLVLFLFIFNWVPLGVIVYVFYGGIKPLPLVI